MKFRPRLSFRRAAVVLVASACVSLAAATPPAHAQAMISVTIGGVPTDDMTPVVYAVHAGLFQRAGLDVTIVPATSGSAMATAVTAGSYTFGKASMLSSVNAYLHHAPLTVIGAGAVYDSKHPFAGLCVAADSTLQTGKDFDGKTVGTPALNDLNQLVVYAWVDHAGGDWHTLHDVELPQSVTSAALIDHRVDGAIMQEPVLADALATKKIRELAPAYDAIAPTFVFADYFTSADYAKAHPDVVEKFMRVVYQAAAYTNAHHADTVDMMASFTHSTAAILSKIPRVDGATGLDPAQFQPMIDAAAKYHLIDRAFPASDMLTNAPRAK